MSLFSLYRDCLEPIYLLYPNIVNLFEKLKIADTDIDSKIKMLDIWFNDIGYPIYIKYYELINKWLSKKLVSQYRKHIKSDIEKKNF